MQQCLEKLRPQVPQGLWPSCSGCQRQGLFLGLCSHCARWGWRRRADSKPDSAVFPGILQARLPAALGWELPSQVILEEGLVAASLLFGV